MWRESCLEAGRTLGAARALPLAGGVAAYLLGALAIGERLRAAARAFATTLPRLRAAAIGLSAVFASHLSFGAAAGEAARLGWILRLCSGRPDAAPDAVGMMAVDRFADGAAIAAMLALALLGGAQAHQLPIVVVALIALAGVAALIVRRGAWRRLARGAAFALPPAIAAWALDLSRVWLVAAAVGLPLPLPALCAIALAALIGGHTPTPGGLGGVEAAMIATGAALGLPAGPLAALVVLDRTLTLALGTALGFVATTALYRTHSRRTA